MTPLDLNQLLAVLGVVVGAVVLPPEAAVTVLAFVLGLVLGANLPGEGE